MSGPILATANQGHRVDKTASGWINGFIGVLIFSGSLPATRVAVMDFDPVYPAAGSVNSSVRVSPQRLAELVSTRWVDVCQLRSAE